MALSNKLFLILPDKNDQYELICIEKIIAETIFDKNIKMKDIFEKFQIDFNEEYTYTNILEEALENLYSKYIFIENRNEIISTALFKMILGYMHIRETMEGIIWSNEKDNNVKILDYIDTGFDIEIATPGYISIFNHFITILEQSSA